LHIKSYGKDGKDIQFSREIFLLYILDMHIIYIRYKIFPDHHPSLQTFEYARKDKWFSGCQNTRGRGNGALYICPLSLFYWHLVPSFIREHSKVRGIDGNSEAPRRIDKYLPIDKYTTWRERRPSRGSSIQSTAPSIGIQPLSLSHARGIGKRDEEKRPGTEPCFPERSGASRSCRETRPPLLLRQTLKYSEEQELLNSNKYLSSSVFQLI